MVLVDLCELDGEMLWHLQKMPLDTSVSYSTVSNEVKLFLDWTCSRMGFLEGFEGSKKMVGFSDPRSPELVPKWSNLMLAY